jgi:flavin reductase (DIM6/NTAB) family NADH-FMN oxidoreductase RutF
MASFGPEDLTTAQLYDLLVEAVQPRPIALVSTISSQGAHNLAPFSFFMAGGTSPPSLAFSPTLGPEGYEKDSLTNVEETGEFVVNVVSREMAEAMNRAAYSFPNSVSEWAASGLTQLDAEIVRPKRVAESVVQFECRVFEIVRHGEDFGSARYVIGEIVRLHVADGHWDAEKGRMAALRLLGRLGGREYVDLASKEIFELARPSAFDPSS